MNVSGHNSICSSRLKYFFTAVRIEWAKARARYLRWSEEVQLLKEEMRRVRKTLEWEARQWEGRTEPWTADAAAAEGIMAYAMRQAQVRRDLLCHFTRMWDKPLVPVVNNEDSGEAPLTALDPSLEMLVEEED
jgi:hypothetical protein